MKLFDVNIKIFSVAAFAIIMLLSFPENSYSQESGEEVENQGLALLDGAIDGIPQETKNENEIRTKSRTAS